MASRPLDPSFAGELVYRGVRAEWIRDDGRLSSMAVTLNGTSLDRSKYQHGPAATLARRPDDAAVAVAEADVVQGHPFGPYPVSGVPNLLDWQLRDDPLDESSPGGPNEAHCQAWVIAAGQAVDEHLALPPGAQKAARRHLAGKLDICLVRSSA